ncbi:MAG: Trans-hexaprenyltranstransferase, partial [Frankiales bacterium]|nr:Trans-hexaprenyltranstransferase [Frankiales bacterium]
LPGAATLAQADPGLRADVEKGLAAVETRLQDAVQSSNALVTQVSRHLQDAGGKRSRPLLALLAAHLGDASRPEVVDAAVVVELTHLASLYHDDVMDEALVRRGAASANARWTNTVAILTGDYLFARASDVVAGLGPEAVRIQSRTFARLVEGQISETAGPAAGEDPVAHHLQVLADKTGSLIATSARLGAMQAGAPQDVVERVAEFGEAFGLAFQLSDDLLDITSETGQSGKTPGTDLREGVRTLPVLLALADDAPEHARLRELLSGPLEDDARHGEALALLRAHPAMAAAGEHLAAAVRQAQETAQGLPAGPAREALLLLAAHVVARTG